MPVNIETAESLEWREKGRDRKVGLNCEQGMFLMLLYMETAGERMDRIYKEYAHLARNQRGGETRGQVHTSSAAFVTLWGKPERNADLETDIASPHI